jgi:hypothetical protein
MRRFMSRFAYGLAAVLTLAALVWGVRAQENENDLDADNAPRATVIDVAPVYAGPSHTFELVTQLPVGQQVRILERNRIGNWLRVTWDDSSGGWLMIGRLNLPVDFTLDDVRANMFVTDADPSTIVDEQEKALYAVPILPTIHRDMCAVYEAGQAARNQAGVVSKIGDSNSASASYLTPIAEGRYDLGPYAFLEPAVDLFGASFASVPVAARVGMNSMAVFDPFWADKVRCDTGESPLACEYRLSQPAAAVIMFGVNDTRVLNSQEYRAQITRLIEESLDTHVIPLLVAFSTNPTEWDYGGTLRFNLAMIEAAREYNVPVINFWSAAQALYRAGVGDDNIHLTQSGASFRVGSAESYYGLPLHNLLVLHALDALRTTCIDTATEPAK